MNKDTIAINPRDPIILLQNEARKKPQLAEIVSNIHFMSENDIRELRVMPWIKNTLIQMKKINSEKEQYKSMMAYMLDKIVDSKLPDPMGETFKWMDQETYIKMGTSMVEIKTGQMVWIDHTGVWLDTIHSKTIDPQLYRYTQSLGKMSRLDYLGMERQRRNGTLGTPPHTVVYNSGQPSTSHSQPDGRFTIYRP
jgi:hypothetical protein